MVSIIARQNARGTMVLYAYAKSRKAELYEGPRRTQSGANGLNTKISLGMEVSNPEWLVISSGLKEMEVAKKKNRPVISVDDDRVLTLWKVREKLHEMELTGRFDIIEAKSIVSEHIGEKKPVPKSVSHVTQSSGRMTLMRYIDEYIRDGESGKRLSARNKRMSASTIASAKSVRVTLNDYQEARRLSLDFDNIKKDFLHDFIQFLSEERTYADGKERLLKTNSISTIVSTLKTIMRCARDDDYHQNGFCDSSKFSAPTTDVENVALSEERVEQLYNLDFSDEKKLRELVSAMEDDEEREYMSGRLFGKHGRYTRKIWQEFTDCFLIGCLTGQRFSDYKRMSQEQITESDGMKFLVTEQVKTGKKIYIPLDKRVQSLLDRHDGHIREHDYKCVIKGLREIGLLLGWTEDTQFKKNKTKRGSNEIASRRFCDNISTHTARRTWATIAHKRGVPLQSIMAVTGHADERTLRNYLKLNEEEKGLNAAKDLIKAGFMDLGK